MTTERSTELEVRASAARAWEVLADFPEYGEWNRFLRRLRGARTPGTKLFVNAKPPHARGMLFRPRLVTWNPPQELAFRGQLLVPGLFDGLYRFTVEPVDAGQCRIKGSLAFSGRLVPLLIWKTGAHMEEGLAIMLEDWKRRVEASSH